MQIGNGSIYKMNPMRQWGGNTLHNDYIQNRFASVIWRARAFGILHSVPCATQPPYSAILAQKGGDLASRNVVAGEGTLSGPGVSLGLAHAASLTGQGTISAASLSMIIRMVADLTASGTITGAAMVGSLSLAADLVGQGELGSALALIVWMTADLLGISVTEGNLTGLVHMSCDISSSGDVVTAQSCAAAVWSALASAYNEDGTMGDKMNSASAAGDPWTALLEDYTDDASFGAFVKKLLTTGKFLGLK